MRTMVTSTSCACAVILASACERPSDSQPRGVYDESAETAGTTGPPGGGMPRVADIVANPSEFLGRTVTVEADVDEVFGPRAFSLDEDAPFAGGIDRDLLVLGKDAANVARIDDQWLNNKVRVTGTVARLSVIDVEREIEWISIPRSR